jgi:cell wall-associated NlpC family hydrolase
LAYAEAQLGKPYQWGTIGPAAFDCSGLTMQAYRAAGIAIPRTT